MNYCIDTNKLITFNILSNKIQLSLFLWPIILLYAFLIQLIPAYISVGIGVFLSCFLYSKYKILSLVVCYIAFFSSNNITFGGIVSFLGIICFLLFEKKLFSFNKEAFLCICILSVYFIITSIVSYFQDIDLIYIDYFFRNIYKEFIIPVLIMSIFSSLKINGFHYFNILFITSLCISIGQLLSIFFGNPVSIYISYQFSISFLLLFLSNKLIVKLLSFFNILVYLYLLLIGQLYFSSQDIMIVLLSIIFYIFIYNKFLFISALSIILFFAISTRTIENPNSFLQNKLNVKPQAAFKLTQLFTVLQSTTLSEIPWSPRVRIVEFVNSFDRNPFTILFGSGFVPSIKESYLKYAYNNGEGPGKGDYSKNEILAGKYYGLHNTPRGFLHYGLMYFIFSSIIFLKNVSLLKSKRNINNEMNIANIFLYVISIWNPYFTSVFFLLNINRILHNNSYINVFL